MDCITSGSSVHEIPGKITRVGFHLPNPGMEPVSHRSPALTGGCFSTTWEASISDTCNNILACLIFKLNLCCGSYGGKGSLANMITWCCKNLVIQLLLIIYLFANYFKL